MTDLRALARWEAWLLFGGCLVLYWLGNGRVSYFDRDEPRYAGTARTMLETGDFIVPYFNDTFRYQKPVLTYWMIAAQFAVLGESAFAARSGAGLCVAAACVVVWFLGNRMFGRPAGILAGTLLAIAPTTVLIGKLCIPDGPQFLFSTVAFACLYLLLASAPAGPGPVASVVHRGWRGSLAVFLFWAAVGLAILTKGPVIPAMLALTAIGYAWLTGTNLRRVRFEWARGLLLLGLIVGPWLAAIAYCAGPSFFQESLGKQVLERAVRPFDLRKIPPGYYLVTAAVGFAPGFALACLGAFRRIGEWRRPGPTAFLLSWAIFPMILVELFRTKQAHYYAPSYPAFALWAGGYLAAIFRGEERWRWDWLGRAALAGQLALAGVVVLALAALAFVGPRTGAPVVLIAAAMTALGAIALAGAFRRERFRAGMYFLVLGYSSAWLLFCGGFLPSFEKARVVRAAAERLDELARKDGVPVVQHELCEPSMVYYANRSIRQLPYLEDYLRVIDSIDGPVRTVLTADSIQWVRATHGDRIEVEETWEGWVKMHRDRLYLVRFRSKSSLVASGSETGPH